MTKGMRMGAVTKLSLGERVSLNPDRLVELCVSMGEPAAEALVTASIDDVARGMEKLDPMACFMDPEGTLVTVRRLTSIADHIGLKSFVHVAQDVETAALAVDAPAYAATLARLHRVATKAQTALWDLQDMMV